MSSQVTVIGGGFSGLTVAYYLARAGVKVEVIEKSERLGGLISTSKFDWGYAETAANGLMGSPLVDNLFRDLNLQYAERPAQATRARYIFREYPRRWPLGTKENIKLATGLAKILGRRYFFAPATTSDDIVASSGLTAREWVGRNLGDSAFDYLIGPALQGIMGTDDIAADLFIEYVRGAMTSRRSTTKFVDAKSQSRSRRGTVSPRHGMGELISALATRIESLGGVIQLNSSSEIRNHGVTILSVPAYTAAQITRTQFPELSQQLANVEYLPLTTATVSFALDKGRTNITHGFGCLFPAREVFSALGVLFSSSIFARVHQNSDKISTETWLFREPHDQETIIRSIARDRSRLLGVTSPPPVNLQITHWPQALPHYNLKLVDTLKALPKFGEPVSGPIVGPIVGPDAMRIYLTGNYLGQIGLGRILSRNFSLARQIAVELKK